jgi:hypothetical protein
MGGAAEGAVSLSLLSTALVVDGSSFDVPSTVMGGFATDVVGGGDT